MLLRAQRKVRETQLPSVSPVQALSRGRPLPHLTACDMGRQGATGTGTCLAPGATQPCSLLSSPTQAFCSRSSPGVPELGLEAFIPLGLSHVPAALCPALPPVWPPAAPACTRPHTQDPVAAASLPRPASLSADAHGLWGLLVASLGRPRALSLQTTGADHKRSFDPHP